MKKILMYFICFVMLIFILPVLLTKRSTVTTSEEIVENQDNSNLEKTQQNYDYKKFGTITLLHKDTRRDRTNKYR